MTISHTARRFLQQEAEAMFTRIDRLVPLSVNMTMVPAASVSAAAMRVIESMLKRGRQTLRVAIGQFLGWLKSPLGQRASVEAAQRRFMILRLRFHAIISHFDIFADVLVQRSEHGNGVWIAGLDDLAADALVLPGRQLAAPPLVCYLDQGVGAAIRRAKTRLPGGEQMPVGVIRVPRERMVGQGIGASLIHEVGHQAAALLDLLPPLRAALFQKQRTSSNTFVRAAWVCLERWCSEIVADLWAVAYLGASATLGLIGVVSLPRALVFRVELTDPHPFPWIRVMLSSALGAALYPHPQWAQIAAMWAAMYPSTHLPRTTGLIVQSLQSRLQEFADLVLALRLPALAGESLGQCLRKLDRSPDRLHAVWDRLRTAPSRWHKLPPTLALAAISQARVDGRLSSQGESRLLMRLLTEWAVQSSLDALNPICSPASPLPAGRVATGLPDRPLSREIQSALT
jgi:hypothetical protein